MTKLPKRPEKETALSQMATDRQRRNWRDVAPYRRRSRLWASEHALTSVRSVDAGSLIWIFHFILQSLRSFVRAVDAESPIWTFHSTFCSDSLLGAARVGSTASKGILTPPNLCKLTLLSTGVGRKLLTLLRFARVLQFPQL